MGRKLGKLPSQELKNLMDAYGADSLEGLAKAMELPYETVRNWYTRNSVPEKHILRAQMNAKKFAEGHLLVNKSVAPTHLAERLAHSLAAAKHGVEDGAVPRAPIRGFNLGLEVQEERTGYRDFPQAVPLYPGMHASAGNGSGVQPGEPPEVHVSFSPSYMRRHFGRAGEGFAMIYVKGDSMQPGLVDGDEIVIDTRHRRVDRDGIYVITLRGDLKVKRIQQKLDGSLVVKSDNPAYEAELVTAAQAEEFTVEGRLVWPRLR